MTEQKPQQNALEAVLHLLQRGGVLKANSLKISKLGEH